MAGCGPTQATSGPGWTLSGVQFPAPYDNGVIVSPAGPNAYQVQLTVTGKGDKDCAAPRFTGFTRVGDVLVAVIERPPPSSDPCLIAYDMTFDVLLRRDAIPPGVSQISHSEPCNAPGCDGHGVPIEPPP
jgi:hypothetical protein